jgi:hypothetical protein
MERDCFNCRFELRIPDEIPCIHCGIDGREYWLPKAKTNADRIRAMTDEELADWIARTQIANVAEALEIVGVPWERKAGMKDEVSKEVLEWLQQPAEGDA